MFLMPTIQINRSVWLYGTEAMQTGAYLRHPKSHKFDIIGQLLHCGYSGIFDNYLSGVRFLSQLNDIITNYVGRNKTFEPPYSFLLSTCHADTQEALELTKVNDDASIGQPEREATLAKLCKLQGLELTFTDGVLDSNKDKLKFTTTNGIWESASWRINTPLNDVQRIERPQRTASRRSAILPNDATLPSGDDGRSNPVAEQNTRNINGYIRQSRERAPSRVRMYIRPLQPPSNTEGADSVINVNFTEAEQRVVADLEAVPPGIAPAPWERPNEWVVSVDDVCTPLEATISGEDTNP